MKEKLLRFMMGRYGNDSLNQVMIVAALVLTLASGFWQPLYTLALLLLVFTMFRMFSRNIPKRRAEGMAFARLIARIQRFFKNGVHMMFGSKTHRYFRCPGCKQQLRAPRGKGQIMVHCSKCGDEFQKKV